MDGGRDNHGRCCGRIFFFIDAIHMTLVNFSLVPIGEVQPWGCAGNHSLSWFGLTDGQYWVQTGDNTLFEYSEQARATGTSRYCDYQVVRLHEDLMEMLPHILEPVPHSLVPYLSGETAIAWRETYGAWCERDENQPGNDRFYQTIDAALVWTGGRWLDSAYLSPSADIAIWSDTVNVYFEWDNRKKMIRGAPAWSAVRGIYQMPRGKFIDEIKSFHERLMGQMSERVEKVVAGALSPEIEIDLPALKREHDQRCRELDKALQSPASTDWQKVEGAIDEILSAQRAA